MPPIEGFISSPTFQKKILAENNQQKHLRIYDLDVNFKGNEIGGDAYIKYGSQSKPKRIHVNPGETVEKTSKIVAKKGIIQEVKMRFTGK